MRLFKRKKKEIKPVEPVPEPVPEAVPEPVKKTGKEMEIRALATAFGRYPENNSDMELWRKYPVTLYKNPTAEGAHIKVLYNDKPVCIIRKDEEKREIVPIMPNVTEAKLQIRKRGEDGTGWGYVFIKYME